MSKGGAGGLYRAKFPGEGMLGIDGGPGRGADQEAHPGAGSRRQAAGSGGFVQRCATPTTAFRRLQNQPL
ncbi:MAG: hypothetical protein LBD58_01350 [Treponema sp.]|nr:hypothetical protein [Treponema sp.]